MALTALNADIRLAIWYSKTYNHFFKRAGWAHWIRVPTNLQETYTIEDIMSEDWFVSSTGDDTIPERYLRSPKSIEEQFSTTRR